MTKETEKIKRLYVFDLDGCLMDSPTPDVGKILWKEKMGSEYPHLGWWGRKESLDTKVFDIKPISRIEEILRSQIEREDTYCVILTSRMEKLRPQVEQVLIKTGLSVDELIMKKSEKSKGEKLLRLARKFPNLELICAFDDRDTDIASYINHSEHIEELAEFVIIHYSDDKLMHVEIIKEKVDGVFGDATKEFICEKYGFIIKYKIPVFI